MAKHFVKLNHYSFVKGAEGEPDQVIEVDDKLAAAIVERGGGDLCDKDGVLAPKKEEKPAK